MGHECAQLFETPFKTFVYQENGSPPSQLYFHAMPKKINTTKIRLFFAGLFIFRHTHTHIRIHRYINNIYSYIRIYNIYIYIYIYIYCIHTYIHIYIYIYIHIYIRNNDLPKPPTKKNGAQFSYLPLEGPRLGCNVFNCWRMDG